MTNRWQRWATLWAMTTVDFAIKGRGDGALGRALAHLCHPVLSTSMSYPEQRAALAVETTTADDDFRQTQNAFRQIRRHRRLRWQAGHKGVSATVGPARPD